MTNEEKRKQKHPDTKWFHYNNVNPKGKVTTDCVYRAISNAMQIPYAQVAREMTEMQIETGWDTGESRLINKYITSKGWLGSMTKFKNGGVFNRVIMNIGSEHLSCVINGKVEDIWNCSNNCVGVWWSA